MVHYLINLLRIICLLKHCFAAGDSNASKTVGVSQPQSLPVGFAELVLTGVRGLPAILIGGLNIEYWLIDYVMFTLRGIDHLNLPCYSFSILWRTETIVSN
jgi:hypothetical protein